MYEPKIEVVREDRVAGTPLSWWPEDGQGPYLERAYLVRGVPVPGELVMDRDGTVHTVRDLEVKWVEVYDGSRRLIKVLRLKALRPYDPEAERLRVATEAVRKTTNGWVKNSEEVARAVLEALKEVDDG